MRRLLAPVIVLSLLLPLTVSVAGDQLRGRLRPKPHGGGASELAARVLVVYDSTITDSQEIAEYYQAARRIPSSNMLDVDFGTVQYFLDYTASGEWPAVKLAIKNKLDALGNTTILYIVLCGNLPYMLYNMPPQTVGEFSFTSIAVDSAITDIYDIVAPAGSMFATNPAYLSAASSANTYPAYSSFASYRDRGGKRVYCVGRIDAHSTAAAKALVDKAIAAEKAGGLSGTGYFDGRFGDITGLSDTDAAAGDWDIYRAKEFWDAAGLATSYDTNDAVYGFVPAPTTAADAAFHWGWYVGRYDDFASVYSSVPNGAIGVQIHSSAGNNWRDSNPAGQYWMGQAIAAGFTIVHGPVGEPFLEGFANADTTVKFLLPPNRAYVGDALLRSQSGLKWQMFTVGDPLYRPFPS